MDKIDGRLWVVTGNADLKEVPWPQELLNISHDSSERIRVEIPALNKDMWFNLNISSRNDHKTVHGVSSLQM